VLVPLVEAEAPTCGGKAAALGALLRAGLPVPDGFVVPFEVYDAAVCDFERHRDQRDDPGAVDDTFARRPLQPAVFQALEHALDELGDPPVAVRSSAADEDASGASAAGQYESILGVRGVADVADAVRVCWASLHAPRAAAYRTLAGEEGSVAEHLAMAVIVHRHLDAGVAGVMFTPVGAGEPTVLEASWGLGPSIVAGTVTPDTYRIHPDGTVTCVVGDKRTRLDRIGFEVRVAGVPVERRQQHTLDDATATRLAKLGRTVAAVLGAPQDIEWALEDGRLWLLQARPITATPPALRPPDAAPSGPLTLAGTPGSSGTATGTARTVRGPQDFAHVQPGDILICPTTDPAWTPLLRIAAGVV